jgi:hypothetical protein
MRYAGGYTRRIADSDSKEDLPLGHYTLKHRLTAWNSVHVFDAAAYTVRHGLLERHEAEGRSRLDSSDVLSRHYDGRTGVLA